MRDWLRVKHHAHRGDAAFVAPLNLFETRRLSQRHNPYFANAEAVFFIAYRGGEPVGRISAQINQRDPSYGSMGVGHFGFFDVIEDQSVASVLVGTAQEWLRARGCRIMRGPFSLSVNEETGCLVEGFDVSPAYLMNQSRPWTGPMLAAAGLTKAMDIHAWRVNSRDLGRRMGRIAEVAVDFKSVRARPLRRENLSAEIRLLADIFNDAWADNWGFVPFGAAQIEAMVSELKLIYRSNYGYFVELDGEPVGVLFGVPNINEIIAPFNGRLTPLNVVKLGWTLHREGARTSRVPLAGLKRRYQSGLLGGVLSAALAQAALVEASRRDLDWFELSWILETNQPARRFAQGMGAHIAATYRLYETEL